MKKKFWITLATYLAWCIDRELYKAIDYLREQVWILVELQEKQNKRIRLNNNQRMRVGILPIAHFLGCQSSLKGSFRTSKFEGRFCKNPCHQNVSTGANFAKSSPRICEFMAERGPLQRNFLRLKSSMNDFH
jgi:hypothetical protein